MEITQIEMVGEFSMIQYAVVGEHGRERFVISPLSSTSNFEEIAALQALHHTDEVKAAFKEWLLG